MRKSIFFILFFASLGCTAQLTRQDKTIAHFGQGRYIVELMQSPDTKDIYIYFQNREFTELTDIKHLSFQNKDSFLIFIADLKLVDFDHVLHRDKYMISGQKGIFGTLYLWIYDAERSGYFWITAKNIKKFEEALSKLE